MCNNSFIIDLHRISGGKKIDEEGKEMEKERKNAVTREPVTASKNLALKSR